MSKLLLVDGNSILNRGFYGLPDLTNSEGLHTNAVLGFLNIVHKIVEEEKPSNVCVAFDLKAPTFRHKMYKEYKGTRKGMPDELREQLPLMKEVLAAMNIKTVSLEGYEADDILGTLSRVGDKAGYKVVLLSGDRDLLQLATDDILVKIPKTKAGKTTVENYYAKDVEAAYGVAPVTFIDLKALMGDTSDNIPGVPGIGEKTASKLLVEYGSLDGVYNALPDMKASKMKTNLEENKELAYLSKTLATIKLDVPIDMDLSETLYDNPYNAKSYELYRRLGFKSLLGRFPEEVRKSEISSNDSKTGAAGAPAIKKNVKKSMDKGSGSDADISNKESIYSRIFADKIHIELPEVEIITEKNVCDDAFDSILNDLSATKDSGKTVGFDFLYGENGCQLASVSYGADKTYVINLMGDLNAGYVSDFLVKAKNAGANPAALDLKYCFKALENSDNFSADSFDEDIYDCGVAAYLINPLSGSYDYSDLVSVYTDAILPDKKELLGKKTIDMFSYTDENVCRYMAYRAYVPYVLMNRLKCILCELDMYKLYADIELPCIYSLYTMERNGIKVDREDLLRYGEKLKSRLNVITDEIYGYAGEKFNINSPKQLGEILFERLGLKHGKKTKTGYSTSVDVLEKIKSEHPIVPLILEYRQLAKLDSTYVEGLSSCICEDGRIHGTFNQTVTATGRLSSTEPNLQNIPTRYPLGKEIRRVFVPEDGYVFLDADYSQIELRVLAHMSGDETLINAYNQDNDIHSITASEVFGVHIDQVTPLMRRNAKAVNFGIVYGISSFGLGQDLDISRKEAENYIEKYFNTYKQVKLYLDETVKFAKENGYSVTMFGRKRPIDELKSSNYMTRSFGERVAMNSPIQGTAADIMKLAMINVDRKLKAGGYKSRLVLQVHDELIIETLKEEFDEVKEILSGEMSGAVKLAVPLIVDIENGVNWLEAK